MIGAKKEEGPALQNLPVRTEEGARLVESFRRKLPDIDYSSIERRIADLLREDSDE